VYILIAQDQAQKKLLRTTQKLTEPRLLGKAHCQPRAATARWTGVRLLD